MFHRIVINAKIEQATIYLFKPSPYPTPCTVTKNKVQKSQKIKEPWQSALQLPTKAKILFLIKVR